MTREIDASPKRYSGICARYCKRRARLATKETIKWFWMAVEMRFEMCRNPTARVLRFKNKPWRHPQFLRR
jgi:hypothetical protein